MGSFREMLNKRIAYKLWLVEEDGDMLRFTDKRYLLTIRIMLLLFTSLPLILAYVMHSSDNEIPFEIYIFLSSFSAVFFLVFLIKSISHKELVLIRSGKIISVRKKRGANLINESVFNFNDVKIIHMQRVARKDTIDDGGPQTFSHFEITMELKNGKEIHFSVVNDFPVAKALLDKISDFVDYKQKMPE